MMHSLKNSVPNHLSISQMWSLYTNLKSGLMGKNPKTYLLDEVLDVLEGIDTESFKVSLRILYRDKLNYLKQSPIDLALLLVNGLKVNNAFDFFDFIRTISRGTS